MRKLIILRGAQGSGKSTFISENNLDNYTLSADKIRLLYSSPSLTLDYREDIPQYNNRKVWSLLFYLLEERMKKGELTFVDAVHANVKESFPEYKKLAEKYRYRLYVLDFTDISIEEVYDRNHHREDYKIVPESAIDRAYKYFAKDTIPSSFKIIKPETFQDIFTIKPRNFDNYDAIHIIGDIHGCYTALNNYFTTNSISSNDLYIFTGDYFDRGLENAKTFNYLLELMKNDNTIFLVGNHEDKLYKYACDDEFKMDYDIEKTIEEFEANNISKSLVRGFVKSLSQITFMEYKSKKYLISHGGIPYIPDKSLDYYCTNSFIYGVDKYDVNIDEIYNNFMSTQEDKVIQIHGHRNYYKIKYDEYPYSLNLEGDIEHGGNLRILTIDKQGNTSLTEVKNDIYDSSLDEKINTYNLISEMRKSKYIMEKDLGASLSSFNFTREAFQNRIWDSMTTQARGLFVDTKNYRIIARSYNKFFKVNERKETSFDALSQSLKFPINAYLKYNGFLGILSVFNDELFFASKSTNEGPFVDYFKTIFYDYFNPQQIEAIKNKIIQDNSSFVFEVIDPLNDPHIIEYTKPQLILLDIISNTLDFSKLPYTDLQEFSHKHKMAIKACIYQIENQEEFLKIYEEITDKNYKLDSEYVEGFVFEDSNNYMVKTKTAYYDKWKSLRGKMEYALKHNDFITKSKDDEEINFMSYLKKTYENSNIDIKSIDIISERKKYENPKEKR